MVKANADNANEEAAHHQPKERENRIHQKYLEQQRDILDQLHVNAADDTEYTVPGLGHDAKKKPQYKGDGQRQHRDEDRMAKGGQQGDAFIKERRPFKGCKNITHYPDLL